MWSMEKKNWTVELKFYANRLNCSSIVMRYIILMPNMIKFHIWKISIARLNEVYFFFSISKSIENNEQEIDAKKIGILKISNNNFNERKNER